MAADFRVIRYDSRGYGPSPAATEEFSQLGDLRAVLDHFGVTQVHIVGCSMGGGTAVELAVAEPHQVRSLVLLCPSIPGYEWPEEPELDAEYQALITAGDEDGLVRLGLREQAAAGDDPLVAELMRSAARAAPSESSSAKVSQCSAAWKNCARQQSSWSATGTGLHSSPAMNKPHSAYQAVGSS